MIRIDHQLLVEVGLGHLDEREQQTLLRRIGEILALRVGYVLSSSLTHAQRATFERLSGQGDNDGALAYLATEIPSYAMVVRDELDTIAQSLAQGVRRGAVMTGEMEHYGQENN